MRIAVYNEVKSHLQEMNENDLKKQVRLIRAALFFKEIGHDSIKGNEETKAENLECVLPANKDVLMEVL